MSVKEMKTELKAIMVEANYLKGVLEAKKGGRDSNSNRFDKRYDTSI